MVDHGFISKEYIFISMRRFGEAKAKPRKLMLKVDNIIPSWRVGIPNTFTVSAMHNGSIENNFLRNSAYEAYQQCNFC